MAITQQAIQGRPIASSVKGIQRGTVILSSGAGNGSKTVTIAQVNPDKTELRLLSSGFTYSGSGAISLGAAYISLTSPTSILAAISTAASASAGNTNISWELTEYH